MELPPSGPPGCDTRDLAARLRHVLWIGGGTGAGKTSITTALAEGRSLQTYHYDFHDSRDHSERIDPDPAELAVARGVWQILDGHGVRPAADVR